MSLCFSLGTICFFRQSLQKTKSCSRLILVLSHQLVSKCSCQTKNSSRKHYLGWCIKSTLFNMSQRDFLITIVPQWFWKSFYLLVQQFFSSTKMSFSWVFTDRFQMDLPVFYFRYCHKNSGWSCFFLFLMIFFLFNSFMSCHLSCLCILICSLCTQRRNCAI